MDEKIPYLPPAQPFLDQLQQLHADQLTLKDMMRKQLIDALSSGISVRIVHHDGSSEIIEPNVYRGDHLIVSGKSKAVVDVLIERERQQLQEGWTPEHDDQHVNGELAAAAGSYALHAGEAKRSYAPAWWPWDAKWFKPTSRRRDLVKATAMLLAEIERLDRLASG